MLAWLRRLAVSVVIGGFSYAFMIGIMIASIVYPTEMAPWIESATEFGRAILRWLDEVVVDWYWGQIAVNFMRERVNMTHVVLSIPAILAASVLFGAPLNWVLGGTRTAAQRIWMAVLNVPTSVMIAILLFSINAMNPTAYAVFLRFVERIWHDSLEIIASQEWIPGGQALVNAARQGLSGHHYVIMALCSIVAAFLINMLFAALFGRKPKTR
jgi:hypothetical protein